MKQEIKELPAALNGDLPSLREWATLRPDINDSSVFTRAVTELTCRLANAHDVKEVHQIRVRNWFDHKWLHFSGTGVVNSENLGKCITEFSSDQYFPPFTPNRILEQRHHCRGRNSPKSAEPVHSQNRIRSSANLNRRILEYCDSGVFLWYSSNSKKNQRASVMVIIVKDGVVDRWHASFIGQGNWRLGLTRGCDRRTVSSLLRTWPETVANNGETPDV